MLNIKIMNIEFMMINLLGVWVVPFPREKEKKGMIKIRKIYKSHEKKH
jgi:hypothetical protein